MAIKLSDLIIMSDIDGTLLEAPNPIPARNLEAVERFTREGGRFALATGRSIESARQYVRRLPVNAPCIVFNGSGIYDYGSEKLLRAHYLPDAGLAHIKTILSAFPKIGAVMLDQTRMYSVADPHYTNLFLRMENQTIENSSLSRLQGRFFKTILPMEKEAVPQVEAFANAQGWGDVVFTRSSPYFLEMLPLGCNKGAGLVQLAESIDVPIARTVCIGDYYNDLEMLISSGFPVTVAGAPDEIKRICRLVTGACALGALADLIEFLERTYPPA